MTNDKCALLRREILSYLGDIPSHVQGLPADASASAGFIALTLGKCLLWVSPQVENGPSIYSPVGTRADSVKTLGEQLRSVGLAAMERGRISKSVPDRTSDTRLTKLELSLSRLENMLENLHEATTPKIGRKVSSK